MKRLVLCVAAAMSLQAATIGELFDALKRQPQSRLDAMQAEYAELTAQRVKDKLYPSASLFASYEHYNSATNLRPVPPTEINRLTADREPIPFAQTIERIGGKVNVPIFVKELFSLRDKAMAMAGSAKARKRLNRLQNEAMILGSDANWRYLTALKKALDARKKSIRKMYEDTKIKVESGRAAGIALEKMEESINRLDMAMNSAEIKEAEIESVIESLTGLSLDGPVPLEKTGSVRRGELFVLKPLQYEVEAGRHDVQAAYDVLYPKVTASAMWSENYAQHDVFTGDDVHRGYGNYMVGISMPLFEKSNFTAIQQAKIDLQKERFRLSKTAQEFEARAKALHRSLRLYERSRELAKKSIGNREKLLAYAKVAYETGRMSEEEYLRYEEALLDAQSRLYEADANYWQALAQLAVIYGHDLSEIVR
jgi:outer membrane protein TolC